MKLALNSFGWEAGIRTPIGGSRVRSLTVRRPPNGAVEFTRLVARKSNVSFASRQASNGTFPAGNQAMRSWVGEKKFLH